MIWHRSKPKPRTPSEATAARKRAVVALQATRAETPRFMALGEALRKIREDNHIAAALETSFRGGQSS